MSSFQRIERFLHYCIEDSENPSNGIAVLINSNRFAVDSSYLHKQLLLLEVRDIIDNESILIINAYINPTHHKKQPNRKILEKIINTIEYGMVNKRKIIIGGDFNHEIGWIKAKLSEFGLLLSDHETTRVKIKYNDPSWFSLSLRDWKLERFCRGNLQSQRETDYQDSLKYQTIKLRRKLRPCSIPKNQYWPMMKHLSQMTDGQQKNW